MGCFSSKVLQPEDMLQEATDKCSTLLILRLLSPGELLSMAETYQDIYEFCKSTSDLRQACILGAVRKYHAERLVKEDVHNRTARYVVILDTFLGIQDDCDQQEHLDLAIED